MNKQRTQWTASTSVGFHPDSVPAGPIRPELIVIEACFLRHAYPGFSVFETLKTSTENVNVTCIKSILSTMYLCCDKAIQQNDTNFLTEK